MQSSCKRAGSCTVIQIPDPDFLTITRQISRVNVTATFHEHGMKIQFCPFDEVEAELTTFCKRFNVSMEVALP
jgi:hypothetical protein